MSQWSAHSLAKAQTHVGFYHHDSKWWGTCSQNVESSVYWVCSLIYVKTHTDIAIQPEIFTIPDTPLFVAQKSSVKPHIYFILDYTCYLNYILVLIIHNEIHEHSVLLIWGWAPHLEKQWVTVEDGTQNWELDVPAIRLRWVSDWEGMLGKFISQNQPTPPAK